MKFDLAKTKREMEQRDFLITPLEPIRKNARRRMVVLVVHYDMFPEQRAMTRARAQAYFAGLGTIAELAPLAATLRKEFDREVTGIDQASGGSSLASPSTISPAA